VALAPARVARAGVHHHHARPQEPEAARTTPAHPVVRMRRTGGVRWEGPSAQVFRIVSHVMLSRFRPFECVSA
jgi:hypothetical protein